MLFNFTYVEYLSGIARSYTTAGSFKFNDCVEGEIKAVYLVNFPPKPVKCVTGLSRGSLFSQY